MDRRHVLVKGVVAVFVALTIQRADAGIINLSNSFYGGTSQDVPAAVTSASGWLYLGGGIYGGFATARLDSASLALAPGSTAIPWGFGKVANPMSDPIGWTSFEYTVGQVVAASSMVMASAGDLYLTGTVNQGYNAGFARVSPVDGSLLYRTSFSPRTVYPSYYSIGASPGGDIVVVNGQPFVFGAATVPTYADMIWVGRRTTIGGQDFGWGDTCATISPPLSCAGSQTGYRLVITSYLAVTYGDTTLDSDVAYSVYRASNSTEGRIMVAAIDLGVSNGSLGVLFVDGSPSTAFTPRAIAVDSLGRIVVAGSQGTGGNLSAFVIRYDGGTRDSTFGTGGVVTLDLTTGIENFTDIAITSNDAIVAVGRSSTAALSARITASGAFDTTYSPTGYQLHSFSGYSAAFNALDVGSMTAVGTANNGQNDLLILPLVDAP